MRGGSHLLDMRSYCGSNIEILMKIIWLQKLLEITANNPSCGYSVDSMASSMNYCHVPVACVIGKINCTLIV